MPDQPCLVKAGNATMVSIALSPSGEVSLAEKNPSHNTSSEKVELNSLYPLPAHDVQHLLSATLVEASPGVAIPDVRLDIERRGREAGVSLLRERRQGLVVPEPGEERPHGVDERSAVPERHCRPPNDLAGA